MVQRIIEQAGFKGEISWDSSKPDGSHEGDCMLLKQWRRFVLKGKWR